jgi:hypothetical protein
MNRILRIAMIGLGFLLVACGLVFAGAWIGSRRASLLGWMQPVYWMMGNAGQPDRPGEYGMMGGARSYNNSGTTTLTIDQAYQAAGKYLAALNNPDLKIAEVMVFDNNAYVRVVEKSSGMGAFELLVDPASLVVYPEPGPNMMWNLKYGGMNQAGMMGGRRGMMGGFGYSTTPSTGSASMPVSSGQALQAAQQYLDTAMPGAKTAADADPFYGYYTIDILRDGSIIGMLSVKGYNSQVFLHSWHGTFVATQDY